MIQKENFRTTVHNISQEQQQRTKRRTARRRPINLKQQQRNYRVLITFHCLRLCVKILAHNLSAKSFCHPKDISNIIQAPINQHQESWMEVLNGDFDDWKQSDYMLLII